MLERIVERVRRASAIREVVVATGDGPKNDGVEQLCAALKPVCRCYRGSESDVLDRYYQCASAMGSDAVVRLTADNPFVDPEVIDAAVERFHTRPGLDHLSYREGLPIGLSAEVFTFDALKRAWKEADDPECREHVTPYLYRNPGMFRCEKAPIEGRDLSSLRLTVDTPEDFALAERAYETFAPDGLFGLADLIAALEKHPEWLTNQSIWQRAVNYRGAEAKQHEEGKESEIKRGEK